MAFTHSTAARDLRCRDRVRAYFVELCGEAAAERRAAEIAARPHVEWNGRPLITLRCTGDFGRGPHNVNVPEWVAWSLIALDAFRCPYH